MLAKVTATLCSSSHGVDVQMDAQALDEEIIQPMVKLYKSQNTNRLSQAWNAIRCAQGIMTFPKILSLSAVSKALGLKLDQNTGNGLI